MPLYLKDKMVSGISLGVPGKSAYEAAKEGGYAGTEEEFNQALTSVPGHITDTENPHSVTAAQVGADVAGAANEALNSAKAYTDQIVAGVIPGDGSKESPADSDSIFIYDNADSGKPKKTLISKLVELFNNTFYTKTEIDTTLQNNDPRQWGLGSTIAPKVTDLNTVFSNGWYRTSDGDAVNFPTTSDGQNHKYGWLFVTTGFYTRQDYYASITDPVHFIRYYVDGNWSPWEIENPPMMKDTEYRTTERYMGKPVYAKAVKVSVLPSAGSFVSPAHNIANFGYCVECSGSLENGTSIPYVNTNKDGQILLGVNSVNIRIYSDIDLSALTAVVKIKYTKTTD